MPYTPSVWASNFPVSASQLNTDLYTFTPGNNHTPNGLLFHSLPPLIMSNTRLSPINQASSTAGVFTGYSVASKWRAAIDNSCLYGAGGDAMGPQAAGHFTPTTPGSGGGTLGSSGTTPGVQFLCWAVSCIQATTNAQGYGATLIQGSGVASVGGLSLSSTTRDNAAYAVDILSVVAASPASSGGYCFDSSAGNFVVASNATDYSGESCTFGALWANPSHASPTAGSLPVPVTGYTSSSVVTSSSLNGAALAAPLTFLNVPPTLRARGSPTTSIPSNATLTPTAVPLTTGADVDFWAGYSTGTSLYTVPVTGVYLVHASINFASNATGERVAGVRINGSTTLWGPSHTAAGGSSLTRPQVLRLLDLQAGDTVGAVAGQNSGGAVALSSALESRLVIKFVAAQAASNGSVGWSAPDTGFRWSAGTPGAQLPALFQLHLANDLSFLIQRPYLMAYQSVQQTGLAQNAFQVITMDQVKGRVHSSAGDNYGGWISGSNNRYVAAVPGWYLAVLNTTQTKSSSVPAHPVAAIGYFTSGGASQGVSPQQSGAHVRTNSTTFNPGAETIGLFYLRAGDYLQPRYQQQDGGATFSTAVSTTGQESSFGCFWVSE